MAEPRNVGLDVGTNMIVCAELNDEKNPVYKKQRDAFLRIVPKSEINRKSIRKALEDRRANFIIDDGDFIIVGEEALYMANERSLEARRPLSKGVLSPKEKDSLPMVKLIIRSLIGKGNNDKLVFSIPGDPVDSDFDTSYHSEMMKAYLKEMGFIASPINEGFAIAFSELLDENLTGMCLSFGAGMVNTIVCYDGDPIVQFSITKGGDWIDQAVGKALDLTSSLVQIEKEEADLDLMDPQGKIQEALAVYYGILINYTLDTIVYELKKVKLPTFRDDVPIVVSGGLTLANNFVMKFLDLSNDKKFPFKIKTVKRAKDPINCVAHGALMASIL